ncbi:MAG TPA: hypothetical protein VK348_13460 [Planctomycetota bacterium]|nr:hypothetical protein [Planctomycetota bacterium]
MPIARHALCLLSGTTTALTAQVTAEQFDAIKTEGLEHAQVMAHLDHLTNRIGPRLTSSDRRNHVREVARGRAGWSATGC